jgi:hypothetical protein
MALPTNLPWERAAYQWATALNPVVQQPLVNSSQIDGVNLIAGETKFSHKLGRTPQGWMVVDKTGYADIFRSAPFNPLTLTLTSSFAVTVSVLVY